MTKLRILSYLPNPRLWKATIAARLAAVPIEVRQGTGGFAGKQLYKTEAFLDAAPFGAIPAAFSPDGKVGIFESNSEAEILATTRMSKVPRGTVMASEARQSSHDTGAQRQLSSRWRV